jgi:hypothetical protein
MIASRLVADMVWYGWQRALLVKHTLGALCPGNDREGRTECVICYGWRDLLGNRASMPQRSLIPRMPYRSPLRRCTSAWLRG